MFRAASLTVTIPSAYLDIVFNYTVGMAKFGWEEQLLVLVSVRRYLKLPLGVKGAVAAVCRMALPLPLVKAAPITAPEMTSVLVG